MNKFCRVSYIDNRVFAERDHWRGHVASGLGNNIKTRGLVPAMAIIIVSCFS